MSILIRVLTDPRDTTPARPGERFVDACGASPLGLFRSADLSTRRTAFVAWLRERLTWDGRVKAFVRSSQLAAGRPPGLALRCFCVGRYHAEGLRDVLIERAQ